MLFIQIFQFYWPFAWPVASLSWRGAPPLLGPRVALSCWRCRNQFGSLVASSSLYIYFFYVFFAKTNPHACLLSPPYLVSIPHLLRPTYRALLSLSGFVFVLFFFVFAKTSYHLLPPLCPPLISAWLLSFFFFRQLCTHLNREILFHAKKREKEPPSRGIA